MLKLSLKLCGTCLWIGILTALTAPLPHRAAEWVQVDGSKEGPESPQDLTELSLEELINVEVTSVSRKEEPIFRAPSAVSIVTGSDIRRSGATSIPEALRLVPGLQVAQATAHDWAISSRGFNDLFANKLLVLMDGRSVYTPLYSGVIWDVQDTLLEDIDRIEVIRGPGATLWGANAVNGVINIITKNARDTQGLLLSGGGGTEEIGFGNVRYGGQLGEHTHYRVYTKYFNRDDTVDPSGNDSYDAWWMARAGFRADYEKDWVNTLTFQGDLYDGELRDSLLLPSFTLPNPVRVNDTTRALGGNALGRWTHHFTEASILQFQMYYDRTERDSEVLKETRNTFDLDLHHRFPIFERHEIIWGLGSRVSHDEQDDNNLFLSFDPTHRTTQLYSSFLQTEWELLEEKVKLTLGSKFEHNDYTGFEVQPGVRLTWTPDDKNTLWGSVSRAVRTPSRVEDDGRVLNSITPGAPPTIVSLFGNNAYESEELTAYEIGYRIKAHPSVSVEVATFYNDYDSLRSFNTRSPFLETTPAPPHVVIPFIAVNDMEGETYGAEVAVEYKPLDWWRWRASYSYLQMELHLPSNSPDPISESAEGTSPHHQAGLRSSMDLPHNLQFDVTGRYVDNLPTFGIPSYVAMDVRLGWRPWSHLEFAIVGQNLLDSQHPEFGSSFIATPPVEIQRAVYGKITLKF